MFERLGRIVPRLRFLLVAVWLLAAGLALLAPSLSSVSSADETSFLPRDAESLTARSIAAQAFPADAAATTAEIVFERKTGLTDEDRSYIEGLKGPIEQAVAGSKYVSPGSPQNQGTIVSKDGQMEMSVVNLSVPAFQPKANQAIDDIRSLLRGRPGGLTAEVTGQAGIGRDYLKAINDGTDTTTLVTIVLVMIVLLLIYRAPLAAMVPLITIGLAFVVARGLLGFLAQRGWQLSTVIDSFIVVLVFGVGTDYTIFLISRFREELAKAPLAEATRATIARIGAVITASAATVIVGLSAMVVARFGMIQTTGPALALTIFITLLAGLTLTPSLLALLGRWLFWPFHPRPHEVSDVPSGVWDRLAGAISAHAGLISIVVLVALAAPLVALPQVKQSFDVPSELPANADSRLGFETIGDHVDKGQLLRLMVVVRTPNSDLSRPAALQEILALERSLGLDNVASVASVVDPAGDGAVPAGLHPVTQLKAMADSFRAAPNPDINAQLGDAALGGIRDAERYVNGLETAYPSAGPPAAIAVATDDLAAIDQGLVQMRAEASVVNQLNAIADRLQLASTTPSSSETAQQLAQLKAYLDELGAAYPDARGQASYAAAQASIVTLQGSRDAGAYLQLVGSIHDLSKWFAQRPTTAYFAPKSIPASSDIGAVSQRVAAARQKLPGELEQIAGTFQPQDLYVPPAPAASGGGSTTATSSSLLRSSFFSADGDVTRLFVTTKSDPYDTSAFATVEQIRSVLASFRSRFGDSAEVYLGGATAEFADIQRTINEDFLVVAGFTIAGILIVLILLLRSVFAPIYLVATVLLSYLTSLSLSALILQHGFAQPGINYFIPLMVFVLLVALGSDYNIFLMSRIREEAAVRGLRPGLRVASARTGTVITSAGLILAGTFGALVTSPLQLLFQVGVTVALGVLIDTFIVRSLLVPALTTVAGERAWWPSHTQIRAAVAGAGASRDGGRRVASAGLGGPDAIAMLEATRSVRSDESNGHLRPAEAGEPAPADEVRVDGPPVAARQTAAPVAPETDAAPVAVMDRAEPGHGEAARAPDGSVAAMDLLADDGAHGVADDRGALVDEAAAEQTGSPPWHETPGRSRSVIGGAASAIVGAVFRPRRRGR